jgi:hypothetical protein
VITTLAFLLEDLVHTLVEISGIQSMVYHSVELTVLDAFELRMSVGYETCLLKLLGY